ncbi:helix-turn-helix domain-containing protein [Bailinhaonella thermotolerans]|uniref:Helix-turn-helix domain-containing protein n=1 Tax=Bailinhaonella thermotolerans TaxID=1070861 RepID=A0A3A4B611_9ACTN|nr:helix-turn-helix domain-containing protein [Bailinhaonella thermotolerans]RJL32842.1 helix-turn-helix domain-containing protein [Bailinhaonella thermotolerans]
MGRNPGVVALAVTEGVPLFEVSIAWEVFGLDRRGLHDPWYTLRVCAADPGTTRTRGGFAPHTAYDLEGLVTADTVIVPALPDEAVRADDVGDPRLLAALREAHARGARVMSLCTGAFALAAAGLLDGRRATTHWMHTDTLAARYPRVRVEPGVLYVDEGDVLTSAGRSAGLDLCLHVVRSDLGAEIANQVARRMVVAAHRPGGQAQYIESPMPREHDEGLAPLLQWALQHLDRPLTVAQLAARAGLSARTLARRFHEATGTTPLRWLHDQRLARARHLLEATDLPVERISRLCGLGSPGNLRHHFTRSAGVTPMEYRRTFRGRDALPADPASPLSSPS